MRLTILGSGTAVPEADRFPAGYLVATDQQHVMVDLGPGSLRRLAQCGVTLHQLDAVLLTHYHTDHCADLAALLFALRNPNYAGRKPLQIFGAAGLRELLATLTVAWPWLSPRGFDLQVTEIEPGDFALSTSAGSPLQVKAVRVEHTDASLAYRLTDMTGRSIAFSGDADVCPGLAEVAQDTDIFVCEAAFPEAHRTAGHLTPRLAAQAAAQANTGHLVLTHFYPECHGHDLLGEARQAFAGPITLARDLMRF